MSSLLQHNGRTDRLKVELSATRGYHTSSAGRSLPLYYRTILTAD